MAQGPLVLVTLVPLLLVSILTVLLIALVSLVLLLKLISIMLILLLSIILLSILFTVLILSILILPAPGATHQLLLRSSTWPYGPGSAGDGNFIISNENNTVNITVNIIYISNINTVKINITSVNITPAPSTATQC